jgi:hypothetical protein
MLSLNFLTTLKVGGLQVEFGYVCVFQNSSNQPPQIHIA